MPENELRPEALLSAMRRVLARDAGELEAEGEPLAGKSAATAIGEALDMSTRRVNSLRHLALVADRGRTAAFDLAAHHLRAHPQDLRPHHQRSGRGQPRRLRRHQQTPRHH